MKQTLIICGTMLLLFSAGLPANAQESEFKSLFNGKDLDGWKGTESLWSVNDGVVVGQTTDDEPIKANTFLVWQGGEVGDFEFRCQVRFEGNNSGVQYRSALVDEPNLALAGYQADLHPKPEYMGMMYGEKTGRGIMATGGQRVAFSADGKKKVLAKLAPAKAKGDDKWNQLRIIAVGNRMIHQVNGVTTVDVTDDAPEAKQSGLLGLQLHRGPAMKVEFRNMKMRKLTGDVAKQVMAKAVEKTQTLADPK